MINPKFEAVGVNFSNFLIRHIRMKTFLENLQSIDDGALTILKTFLQTLSVKCCFQTKTIINYKILYLSMYVGTYSCFKAVF